MVYLPIVERAAAPGEPRERWRRALKDEAARREDGELVEDADRVPLWPRELWQIVWLPSQLWAK